MPTARRISVVGFAAIAWLAISVTSFAQEQSAVLAPALTPAQMEDFLLHARVVKINAVGKGVTNTRRATLSDGQITHDASIQTVDIAKAFFQPDQGPAEIDFKDAYRYNIAGYRLARMLGLTNVPMSVERTVDGTHAAVTWWIDDVAMDEGQRLKKEPIGGFSSRTAGQIHIMRVFDELIANTDRNAGNLLWTKNGDMWLIDHTRAFRLRTELKNRKLLERCERQLCEAMRSLTPATMKEEMRDSLSKFEIEALLVRRDAVLKLFDALIAERGENKVLYTLMPR
jgi:hypothetical protein